MVLSHVTLRCGVPCESVENDETRFLPEEGLDQDYQEEMEPAGGVFRAQECLGGGQPASFLDDQVCQELRSAL